MIALYEYDTVFNQERLSKSIMALFWIMCRCLGLESELELVLAFRDGF